MKNSENSLMLKFEDAFEIVMSSISAKPLGTEQIDIVLTTGGTGLGPRDVTPEATIDVCQKMVPGLAEAMRSEGLKKTKNAILSRGSACIRGNTLIINLPGSPKGVKESMEAILDVLPHAVDMMRGAGH